MAKVIFSLSPCLIVILFISTTIDYTQSQVVTLRHPESNQHHLPPRRQPPQPVIIPINNNTVRPTASSQQANPRFTAKPGNVIVHFDRSHEIQLLQYVLRDGRLATLYQRNPQHPLNSRLPIEVPSDTGEVQVHRRDDIQPTSTTPIYQTPSTAATSPETSMEQKQSTSSSSSAPETSPSVISTKTGPVRIDNNSTIEIVDSKMQSVSKLIGDHLTLALPDHSLSSGGSANTKTDNNNNSDKSEDERLDILATVAVDALAAGAQVGEAKLKKAGVFMDKLRNKITAKLHDLPAIIGAKLRAKSTTGQVFIDQYGNKIQLIDNLVSQDSTKTTTGTSGQQQPAVSGAGTKEQEQPTTNVDTRRVISVPTNFRLGQQEQQQQGEPKMVYVRYNQQLSPQQLYSAD